VETGFPHPKNSRRSIEEGIRRLSRYLATVRRAMSTPSARRRCTSARTAPEPSPHCGGGLARCGNGIPASEKFTNGIRPRRHRRALPPALDRGGDPQALAVLGDGAAGDVDALGPAIPGAAGAAAHSSEAVRYRIKQLIDAEPANDVLSDDALVQRLRAEGVDIARRTVAKYRESLRMMR
jgi:hypothetical protein